MEPKLAAILEEVRRKKSPVLALTGAGISAESGIPTFRGKDGYWVVGSANYTPQEMATRDMFDRAPEEVWRWYLHRFGSCQSAQPNAGHLALVELERALGPRFTLVTQNIDGLHRKAGSDPKRTFCIHGDAAWVRCVNDCGLGLIPLPDMGVRGGEPLSTDDRARLTCPRCKAWLRPHVLWFDECYDEENYRAESALRAAMEAQLLITVGTTGATNLPMQIAELTCERRIPFVDVNPEAGRFAVMAHGLPQGFFAQGTACDRLPEIVQALAAV